MNKSNLLSIADLSVEDALEILNTAEEIAKQSPQQTPVLLYAAIAIIAIGGFFFWKKKQNKK